MVLLFFLIVLLALSFVIWIKTFGSYTTYLANRPLKEYNLYPDIQIKYGRVPVRRIGWAFNQVTPRCLDDEMFHKVLPVLRDLDYTKSDHTIWIHIRNSAITNKCFENLDPFPEVVYLDISYTDLTNDSIEHLKCFPNLKWLFIGNTSITNDSIEHLKCLQNIRQINIDNTAITMDMIEILFSNHEHLQSVQIDGKSISRRTRLPPHLPDDVHEPENNEPESPAEQK